MFLRSYILISDMTYNVSSGTLSPIEELYSICESNDVAFLC